MNPTPTNIPIEEIVANSRLAFMHGKYEPTILPDGTPDYSIPGHGAYIQKAGDTTYFRHRMGLFTEQPWFF